MFKGNESILSIANILKKFEDILKKLLSKINEENINPDNYMKILDALYDFIGFSRKIVFPMITSFINSQDSVKDILLDDFIEIKNMIFKLFDDIESNIRNMKSNIKTDDNKIDVKNLKKYLNFISVLISDLSHMLFVTIKYANKQLTEEEYIEEYELFKSNLEQNKKIFKTSFM